MTSEAPLPSVSVRTRAREIEARQQKQQAVDRRCGVLKHSLEPLGAVAANSAVTCQADTVFSSAIFSPQPASPLDDIITALCDTDKPSSAGHSRAVLKTSSAWKQWIPADWHNSSDGHEKICIRELDPQKNGLLRTNDDHNLNDCKRENSPTGELEIVKNILAKLDFEKYKRGFALERDKSTNMEEKSPKPPRTQKTRSGRFKDLFDLLKLNSDASSNLNQKPYPLYRSLSFSNSEDNSYSEKLTVSSKDPKKHQVSTLPRTTKRTLLVASPVPAVASCPSILKMNQLSLDEGMDPEIRTRVNKTGHYRSASDNVAPSAPFIVTQLQKTNSDEKLWNIISHSTEKRKRRKGTNSHPYELMQENSQKKSSEECGLKSHQMLPERLIRRERDSVFLKSDLSLVDSQMYSSEGTQDETSQDVVESVMHSLSVDGSIKHLKKKHHSDPGGEACTPESTDSFIGCSRSDPDIGCNTLSTISSAYSSAASEMSPNPVPFRQQLKLVVDGQIPENDQRKSFTSEVTPSSRFLFPDSKSPQEQRRYSKRRLRGPYGEMLEEEMRKSGEKQKPAYSDLSFLEDINNAQPTSTRPAMFLSSQSLDDASSLSTTSRNELFMCVTPKRKISANYPLLKVGTIVAIASDEEVSAIAVKSESFGSVKNSSCGDTNISRQLKETNSTIQTSSQDKSDTRSHVINEILDTEKSYVESLRTLVTKYMIALKSTDYNGVVEGGIVDEIFFQIPEILSIHEEFLENLFQRCQDTDSKFTLGDIFIDAFTKQQVIDTYTAFINNWKCAKDATKIATQAKPAFARFLECMSREHKGKLALDALLIMPVQRIPRYELLLKELLKHTSMDHPDHHILTKAQIEVHDLAVKINRVEREAYQHEQMLQRLKEIEHHIEGVIDLCVPQRAYIRHDVVNIPGGLGAKKERCLFLFTDILLITSIKRKSTAMRKPSSTPQFTSQSPFSALDSNKYKFLTRFPLQSIEISKCTDTSVKRAMKDIAILEEDVQTLMHIKDLLTRLTCPHQTLEDVMKDFSCNVSKQIMEKQNNDLSLISIELTVTTQERVENLILQFSSPERRAVWSAAFLEAKQKLAALSTDEKSVPELYKTLPIRKTRAGLQFTCAAATLGYNHEGVREVWVCNSDGYVGQVCVLSLTSEPAVMSCNGVCNARILTIAAIPAGCTMVSNNQWRQPVSGNTVGLFNEVEEYSKDTTNNPNLQLDSDSSEEDDTESTDEDKGKDDNKKRGSSIHREEVIDESDNMLPTMWLGTEDGCVYVYNCHDNIRTKKNKIKIQHECAIHCIIYFDHRVFLGIASGEVYVYKQELDGGWSACDPQKVTVGGSTAPVTAMTTVAGKLWCGCQNNIFVINTLTLDIEHSFSVTTDVTRTILCMVTSGLGVWTTVTPSAVVRLFHAITYEALLDINVAPTVAKILSAATDDIIKQHKSACLRVTAMLTCKDLLWIGTSAGVLLTLPLPHLTTSTNAIESIPVISGLPQGHTGHVRFLTSVEIATSSTLDIVAFGKHSFRSSKIKEGSSGRRASTTATPSPSKLLVISGGDGSEEFSTNGHGEQAGHDDSTNHLLLWQV